MNLPSGYHPTLCHDHAQVKPCSGCEELDKLLDSIPTKTISETDMNFIVKKFSADTENGPGIEIIKRGK